VCGRVLCVQAGYKSRAAQLNDAAWAKHGATAHNSSEISREHTSISLPMSPTNRLTLNLAVPIPVPTARRKEPSSSRSYMSDQGDRNCHTSLTPAGQMLLLLYCTPQLPLSVWVSAAAHCQLAVFRHTALWRKVWKELTAEVGVAEQCPQVGVQLLAPLLHKVGAHRMEEDPLGRQLQLVGRIATSASARFVGTFNGLMITTFHADLAISHMTLVVSLMYKPDAPSNSGPPAKGAVHRLKMPKAASDGPFASVIRHPDHEHHDVLRAACCELGCHNL
jgi:hypothetical protein